MTSDGTNGFVWDARNHLASIKDGRTTVASFQYDPFGRRSSRTVSGATTAFLYDGVNPVQELSGGTPIANLLTGLGVDEVFTRTDGIGPPLLDWLADQMSSENRNGNRKKKEISIPEDEKTLLTSAQVAHILQISQKTLRR